MYPNELYHHGIKGMKWGVRRYQNYDGSYTKKGLARYNKAMSDYESAKKSANETKTAYKSGSATKQQYKDSKVNVKAAKRELNKSYDNLKTDKLADEGKKLYKQGKTISGNSQKKMVAQTAIVAGSGIAQYIIKSTTGNEKIANIAATTIALGGTAANAIIAGKTASDNKKLRAYYAH